jgi:hypothetical protein
MGVYPGIESRKQRLEMAKLQADNVTGCSSYRLQQLLRKVAGEIAVEYFVLE